MGKMFISRVGEKRMMNCGMEAEIIAYRNALDIDVQLSDGRIVKGCQYNTFKHGAISGLGSEANSAMALKNNRAKRIGEKRVMNNGLEAEIIAYRAYADIDVRMSDGRIVRGRQYGAFERGEISGLGVGTGSATILKKYQAKRTGEKHMMNCGLEAEIIAYRNALDIDVQLSDGRIVKGCRYNAFKRGSINGLGIRTVSIRTSKKRTGEKHMMNCGMEAEIIAYRNALDIDVQLSDGRIVRGCQYNTFKHGSINGLGIRTVSIRTSKKRIGEKRMMNCGMEAEIIAYRGYEDIDIRFADGTIREHCRIDNFLSGSIGKVCAEERLGEKRMMNCGLEAEIIAYRNAMDMDVRMSDGRIVKGCHYDVFKRCAISGLGAGSHRVMTLKNNQFRRIGEKRMMNCGIEAEIIAYRACSDIDVRLSDGSIYEHKQYWAFSNGKIGPNHRSAAKK